MKFVSILVLVLAVSAATAQLISPFFTAYTNPDIPCQCDEKVSLENEDPLKQAQNISHRLVDQYMKTYTVPGIVVGVSKKGKTVYNEAFGYADIENKVKTRKDSHFRIASISKSLTTLLVAKLVEEGKLDWNKTINDYIPQSKFPAKKWKGQDTKVTLKQLMSHIGGIRPTNVDTDFNRVYDNWNNVTDTLEQFKTDELISEPGTRFNYSNPGWQIVGAIAESVLAKSNETYESRMNKLLQTQLNMTETSAERREKIIPNRVRYYRSGGIEPNDTRIFNTVMLDDIIIVNKYWPAGGIMSTVPDLLRFGNIMLYSFKGGNDGKPGYLKTETVKLLWKPVVEVKFFNNTYYGMGWFITQLKNNTSYCISSCYKQSPITHYVWHTGGLIGLSSLLAVFPEQEIVVSILANKGYLLSLNDLAIKLANTFIY